VSLFYSVAYWVGLKPWERMAALPIAQQISSLFDREESGHEPPYGAALDLGCGSGIWSATLAARGWQVTGIDIVPKALRAARRRTREAGVEARFIQGDLTALRWADVGSGFRFVLDFGVIHGMKDSPRRAVGREVSAVTVAGATMLILAWEPGQRGPLPRGMSRADLEAVLPEWRLIDEEVADVSGSPAFIAKARPHFYRLRRE